MATTEQTKHVPLTFPSRLDNASTGPTLALERALDGIGTLYGPLLPTEKLKAQILVPASTIISLFRQKQQVSSDLTTIGWGLDLYQFEIRDLRGNHLSLSLLLV